MNNKATFLTALLAAAGVLFPGPLPADGTDPFSSRSGGDRTRIPLTVVYYGVSGSTRTGDFASFLAARFARVEVRDVAAFSAEEAARGGDVILLDGEGAEGALSSVDLPRDFTRPVVTLGAAGGRSAGPWG